MHNQKFSKLNRLKGVVATQQLFSKALIKKNYPIKLFYTINLNKNNKTKFGVSAPKKIFKRAVDRNLIKRKLREIIRKNKSIIEDSPINIDKIMLIYIGNSIPDYNDLQQKIISLLSDLTKEAHNINIDKHQPNEN